LGAFFLFQSLIRCVKKIDANTFELIAKKAGKTSSLSKDRDRGFFAPTIRIHFLSLRASSLTVLRNRNIE